MTGLEVGGLVVRHGGRAVVDGVDLTVAAGEVVCLLGPSGCGKSTLLRAVAGLVEPAAGRIRWDGHDLAGVPTHRRQVGLMFQDYALFPHLDVAANVGFGLRVRGADRVEVARRTDEVLDLVGLAGAERRSVSTLSGGEQQRVALARAIAPAPRLLLLDEPLAALDRALRARLLGELAALLDRLDVTALHVTHDQEEAFALGDRVAVMQDGRLLQVGAPSAVWGAPASVAVARFLGFTVVPGVVRAGVATGPLGRLPASGRPDGDIGVVVRPDALRLDPTATLRGTVAATTFRGDRVEVRIDSAAGTLDVHVAPADAPPPGADVGVVIDPTRTVVLPA